MNISSLTRPFPSLNTTVAGDRAVVLKTVPAGELNFRKIEAIAERLAMHSHPSARRNNDHFVKLCFALAWGIDYGVAKKEVPKDASMFAPCLKQVCCCKNEFGLQSAIMVLMISVKSACNVGWFTANDARTLLTLASEVGSYFVTTSELTNETTDFMPIVSGVMLRFYPQLKLGHVVTSLEVKPGYGTYMADFHMSKNTSFSQEGSIRLLVVMEDNIDTSSCIVNPQQVNILLNGKGVIHRTNVSMDQGAQLPTELNKLLKYDGMNLLQAVGQSNGRYVILVAFMDIVPPAALPMPQDYVLQNAASLSSDSEVIEGPSSVCLNCPISFQRIRTPVKGYMCKHYQCFDLSNYLEVNFEQRPSWKCPCCNQSVCFPDLRVDQNMAKILKEEGENVTEVIISLDGSWKAASNSNCKDNTNSANPQEGTKLPVVSMNGNPSDNYHNVYDLTREDSLVDTLDICEPPDVKPIVDPILQCLSLPTNSSIPPVSRCSNEFNQNSSPQLGNCLPDYFQGTNYSTSPMVPCQFSAPNGLHSQSQDVFHGQSITSNQFGTAPMIPRNVTRVPSSYQALLAQTATFGLQQHSRPSVRVPGGNRPSLSPQVARTSNHVDSNFQRKRQFQEAFPFDLASMTSTSLQNRSASQVAGYSTPNYNMNWRPMAQTLSQPPHLSHSISVPRYHNQQPAVSLSPGGNVQPVQLVRRLQPQSVRPGSSFPGNPGTAPQAVSRTENLIDLRSGVNWRPAERMRGALTGEAYSWALNRLMGQTTHPPQQVQAPIPRPSISSSSPLHVLLANRASSQGQGQGQGQGN